MLKFNEIQLETLRRHKATEFHDRCVQFAYTIDPSISAIGEGQVRLVASSAVECAQGFGLRQSGAIGAWLKASLKLGTRFNVDPQFDGIMPDYDPLEYEIPFAIHLDRAVEELSFEMDGEDGRDRRRALETVTDHDSIRGLNTDDLIGFLEALWPAKFDALGRDKICRLIHASRETISPWGLTAKNENCWINVVSFFFGIGWAADPRFPSLHRSSIPSGMSSDDGPPLLEERFQQLCGELCGLTTGGSNGDRS